MKRSLCLILAILLMALTLASCQEKRKTLTVCVDGYGLVTLTEQTFEKQAYHNKWLQFRHGNSGDTRTPRFIDLVHDTIQLSYRGEWDPSEQFYPNSVYMANGDYLVGYNGGEFDGWVRLFPYVTRDHDENNTRDPGELLVTENCLGFYSLSKYFDPCCEYYILTGLAHMRNLSGNVYKMTYRQENEEWVRTFTHLADLGQCPDAVTYDAETKRLWFVTRDRIAYMEADGTIVDVVVGNGKDILWYGYASSMMLVGSELYVVVQGGILLVDTESGSYTWYELDKALYQAPQTAK